MTSDLTRFCHMCSEKLRWFLFSFYSFLNQSSDCRWSSNHSLITAGLCNRNVIIDTRPAKWRNVNSYTPTAHLLLHWCSVFEHYTKMFSKHATEGVCSISLSTHVDNVKVSTIKSDKIHAAYSLSTDDSSLSQSRNSPPFGESVDFFRVHNSLPLNHIPSHMNPAHALISYFSVPF